MFDWSAVLHTWHAMRWLQRLESLLAESPGSSRDGSAAHRGSRRLFGLLLSVSPPLMFLCRTSKKHGRQRFIFPRRQCPNQQLLLWCSFALDKGPNEDDRVFEHKGAKLVIDSVSYEFVRGATVDFADELIKATFEASGLFWPVLPALHHQTCMQPAKSCKLSWAMTEIRFIRFLFAAAGCGEPQCKRQLWLRFVLCPQGHLIPNAAQSLVMSSVRLSTQERAAVSVLTSQPY